MSIRRLHHPGVGAGPRGRVDAVRVGPRADRPALLSGHPGHRRSVRGRRAVAADRPPHPQPGLRREPAHAPDRPERGAVEAAQPEPGPLARRHLHVPRSDPREVDLGVRQHGGVAQVRLLAERGARDAALGRRELGRRRHREQEDRGGVVRHRDAPALLRQGLRRPARRARLGQAGGAHRGLRARPADAPLQHDLLPRRRRQRADRAGAQRQDLQLGLLGAVQPAVSPVLRAGRRAAAPVQPHDPGGGVRDADADRGAARRAHHRDRSIRASSGSVATSSSASRRSSRSTP